MFKAFKIGKTRLFFSSLRNIKTSSLGVFANVGARLENKKIKGVAHFIEHMLFKGSDSYSYKRI